MTLYIRELCDMNDPEEGKVLSKIAYLSIIDEFGRRGTNPHINCWYFKYNGTKKEFEKARRNLRNFEMKKINLVNKLIDKIESSNRKINSLSDSFFFEGISFPITVSKNK
ncbi:MAG: hypothetical protein KKB62_01325 [Nanoarchaeota archaeon]|nr:hypothetical protein [Nanoarchaeota archaeon]